MITREFNLYLNAGVAVAPVINANQFDHGEEWIFTLLQSDGTVYTPSTGAIIGLKQDGTTILNAGTVNADGQVVITETEQMTAVPGSNLFEILIDGNTHGTANFVVFVERRPGDIDNPSESDISLFQQAIDASGNIIQFEADIDNLKDDVDDLQTGLAQETTQRQTQDAVLGARVDEAVTAVGETGETVLYQAPTADDDLWYVGQTITLSESYSNYDYLDLYVHQTGRESIHRFGTDSSTIVLRSTNLIDTATSATSTMMYMYETTLNLQSTTVTCGDSVMVDWNGNSTSSAKRIQFTSGSGLHGQALRIFKVVGVNLCSTNPEVTDIRVGADGTTYPTAGDAVRGQVSDLHDEVDALTEVVGNKADVNGNYDDLTVGTADQLMADTYTTDAEPYIFRKSGGSADIGNREEDTIVGGTVAWNQLAKFNSSVTYDGITSTFSSDTGTLTMNGTTTGTYFFILGNGQTLVTPIDGHKYYLFMDNTRTYNFEGFGSTFIGATIRNFTKSSHMPRLHSLASVGEVVNVSCKPQFIDLTQMFGTAVADAVYAMEKANAGSGVAWFKAQYPLDYYAYNTGELKSVEGLVSHDMVGFNQWDGQIRTGYFNPSGTWFDSIGGNEASVNPIHVLPNTTYYFRWEGTGKAYVTEWTEAVPSGQNPPEGAFIKRIELNPSRNHTFTTSAQTHYIHFNMGDPYTNNGKDICINLLWSGTRNGEYEPYVKHSYPLDSTLTLRGIPKWGTDGMYYDGDTYEADGTVTRKYGVVDLGTLNWSADSDLAGFHRYYATISDVVKATDYRGRIISVLPTAQNYASFDTPQHIMITGYNIAGRYLYIISDTLASVAELTTYLSNIDSHAVYELATPTTETAEPYTNPQIVSPYGTEEYVTTGITAVGHDTQYPTDLKGKLENLPSIPTAPTANGTYVLKATVTSGGVTYAWVAES